MSILAAAQNLLRKKAYIAKTAKLSLEQTAIQVPIELGDKVRDVVTGFEGIVDCRLEWLNGCIRFQVQPQVLADGKPIEAHVFDQAQLVLLVPAKVQVPVKRTGGNRPMPKSLRIPK